MNFELRFYWALLLRRLPVMALFVLVFSGLGVATALKLPDTYATSARLLVEAPQIPDSMVTSTVQTGATEQLDIIEQRLLTRANLIDIANRFEVFENIRQMEPDEVVAAMRQSTRIFRSSGREQATLMTIRFESHSARIAADVVNEYVTLVLEANAEFRTSRAENTLQFFEQEVERLAQDLDRQSSRIARFKSENANALPEDQSYRLGRQTLLQDRLGRLERDIRAGQQQRADIVRVFEATGRVQQGIAGRQRTPQEEQLIIVQAELDHLRETYSADNPRVIRLRNRVEELEAIVEAQTAANASGTDEESEAPGQALLDATLAEIDAGLAALQSDFDSTTAELDALQALISQSAANGIQLADLERDYAIIQTRYNAAVTNLNAARMSERVESTAQGQRITVIENANVPRVPSGPNRTKIAAMGGAAGIGLAGAYFLLLELLNRTVRRPAELTGRFNITPIATIPFMESRRDRMRRRAGLVTAMLAVLIAVPAALWYIDSHYLPLEIIVQKGLGKLGLG